jgi:hypothetical protein
MKNFFAATLVAVSTVFAGGAFAAQDTSDQPYIWTQGEAGLIANPAYKSKAVVDKSEGFLIAGIGENDFKVNPKFASLPNMKHTALFKAGIGEVSLVEIVPATTQMVAFK